MFELQKKQGVRHLYWLLHSIFLQCTRQTRCELIDNASFSEAGSSHRCHRCNILGISCSFESPESAPSIQAAHVALSPVPYSRPHGSPSAEPSHVDSPHNRNHILPPHVQKVGYIEIEDIFPLPPTAPWGLAKVPGGFDWTATPMLAMQNITTGRTLACDDAGVEPQVHAQLVNILGPDNIQSLLQMCVYLLAYLRTLLTLKQL